MFDYIALRIDSTPCNEIITDLIADSLAEIGFESFEPDGNGVTAYIRKDYFNRKQVEVALNDFPIKSNFNISEIEIKGEDWNQEWERNYFKPIVINDKCVVRSSFHNEAPDAPIEILIDPKMAFGTGHHATTAGMIRLLLQEDLNGKSVIDMGTGTGILAILCKKLGADNVTGIEIDPFALENAVENGNLNSVKIKWICGDANNLEKEKPSDYFLANINLNVLLSDMSKYLTRLKPGGKLFLSGFYDYNIEEIRKEADKHGLIELESNIENEWVAMSFQKIDN